MTLITTGLTGTDCLPQYSISDDMVCAGRISGMDATKVGGTVTISSGSSYVSVTDSNGTVFNVKVYNDSPVFVPMGNNEELIIRVPSSNVQNPASNSDFSSIAVIESVPVGTGADYHLVLASTDASGIISEVNNAGHYLPGCDICIKCEGGILQLPETNIDGNITVQDINANNITANDITTTGQFNGDAGGLTNIPTTGLANATTTAAGIVERATNVEATAGTDTNKYMSPAQIKENYEIVHDLQYVSLDFDGNSLFPNVTIAHNLGKVPKFIEVQSRTLDNNILAAGGYAIINNGVVGMQSGSGGSAGIIDYTDTDGTNQGNSSWSVISVTATEIVLENTANGGNFGPPESFSFLMHIQG